MVSLLALALAAPTMAQQASKPAAPLPPQPVSVFARLPAFDAPQLSPDGTKVATKIAANGKQFFVIQPLFGDNVQPMVFNADGDADVNWWRWVNNDWLAIGLGAETEVLNQDIYVRRLLGVSADAKTVRKIGWDTAGQIADDVIWTARDGSARLLLSKQKGLFEDEYYPTVYDVDLASGKLHAVTGAKTNVFQWFADSDGKLRMGYRYDDLTRRGDLLYRANPDKGFDVIEQAKGIDQDLAIPAILAPDGSGFILDSSSGRAAVYPVTMPDLKLGTPLFSSPKYDVDDVVADASGTHVDGISITEHSHRTEWLNPALHELQANLDKTLGAGQSEIISWNADRTRLLVHVGGPSQAGGLYYWDTHSSHLQFLGWYNAALANHKLSPVTTIEYKARDGLGIEAVLTLPRGRDAHNLPLIVMPHGGPAARDDEEWDWWAQFLAENGYAVVQPNYRGSTGYGTEFLDAGHGEWGLKMQDDLDDAVTYLAHQGTIDPKRVCIAGGSYGGYAAMRGAQRSGDIYRCAISYAGVSDLGSMKAYDSQFLNGRTAGDWLKQQAPDFKAISPRFGAAQFSIPILIVHGKMDRRVPVKQSRMMVDALKDAGKTFEYDEQPLADHFFTRAEDRLDFLTRMKAFLDRYNPA